MSAQVTIVNDPFTDGSITAAGSGDAQDVSWQAKSATAQVSYITPFASTGNTTGALFFNSSGTFAVAIGSGGAFASTHSLTVGESITYTQDFRLNTTTVPSDPAGLRFGLGSGSASYAFAMGTGSSLGKALNVYAANMITGTPTQLTTSGTALAINNASAHTFKLTLKRSAANTLQIDAMVDANSFSATHTGVTNFTFDRILMGQPGISNLDFNVDNVKVAFTPPLGLGPVPAGTIVWDTRAGGTQDFQILTSFQQMRDIYRGFRNSNGASQFFETNVDGAGTNARGCQWAAPNGVEQECYLATEENKVVAPATGWHTQFKVYLGKSASGGGQGSVNQWTLGGGNPHQKMFIWTRGSGTDRLYLSVTPTQINIRCDGRNYNSPVWTLNPYGRTGIQTITVYIQPSTGTIRAWLGDTQVANATGQNIGSSGLVDIQESVTTFPGQQQVQYMWDTVVWY